MRRYGTIKFEEKYTVHFVYSLVKFTIYSILAYTFFSGQNDFFMYEIFRQIYFHCVYFLNKAQWTYNGRLKHVGVTTVSVEKQ